MEITLFTLIPFISLLCYMFLLLLLLGTYRNKLARRFTYFILAMVIWNLGSLIMKLDTNNALFWNRILCAGLIAVPIFFFHFIIELTNKKTHKKLTMLFYISAVLLEIGNLFGLVMESVTIQNNKMSYVLGPLAPVVGVWGLFISIYQSFIIYSKIKTREINFKKVKLIFIGVILCTIGGLTNLIPEIGQYPVDITLTTINALLTAYSIYVNGFLEIKLIVRRGLTYSMYTLILSVVFIIMIMGIPELIERIYGKSNLGIMSIVAVLLAMTLQPLKNLIQRGIDRIFYKVSLNHQLILKDFSNDVNNTLDMNELAKMLIKAVNKGIQPKHVYLALTTEEEKYYIYDSEFHFELTENHPICKWFSQGNPILTINDIHSYALFNELTGEEIDTIDDNRIKLIFPLKYRNKLHGLLILSDKKDEELYSNAEIDFLQTLLNNATVILENVKMYHEAREQAITDGLTKLYNHRYFHEKLREIINNNVYDIFSVVMLDVDLFKFYNDVYGHSAGDKVLVKIARILHELTRNDDIVSRYGGEEFALILPKTNMEEAFAITEKIRKKIEVSFYTSINQNELVTISGGISTYPINGRTVEEIVDSSDKAMYIAKETGRNKIVLSNINDEYENVENVKSNINTAYLSSIYALAATIDAKDRYTYGHSESVSRLAVLLAKKANFSEKRIKIIENAGLLHDIGKIGIPENILSKTSKLTSEEYDIMKKHVDISISIIKHVPTLIELIPAIVSHHERYDGLGYPRGLKGENIPIEGRVLSIVDAFDAMITDRPYRKALTIEEAVNELKNNQGSQFDPQLTDYFLELISEGKILEFINTYKRKSTNQ